jgi:peptide/nickel transport system substrate-binding protein
VAQLKVKIKSLWQKARRAWPFFGFLKSAKISQGDIDRKLVYDLSPRKMPNGEQLKHLKKFLNPREFLIVKICVLIVVLNVIYLGVAYVRGHLRAYPASGGNYIEGIVGCPQAINPLYAVNRDIDSDLSRLIYSSLFQYDGDGRLQNDLVDNVTISPDNTQYLIKIKNNVKWHNGGTLTADDIIFTWDLIQNPAYRSPLRPALAGIVAKKIDDTTVSFTLPVPYAPFLDLLTFGILPKGLWNGISPNACALSDLNLKPIGSGPYKFQSLIKNTGGDLKDYKLVVNSDYYGKVPYLKNLDFKFFVDYQEAIKALNDNQITGLSYLPFTLRNNLLAQNSLNIHELRQPQIVALFFNQIKNKNLADKAVRIALAASLDKDQIIQTVFGGIYPRIDGPIMPESFAYDQDITKYNYAPEAAASTIKAKPLSVTLTVVDSGNNTLVAEQIKNYWEKVGVNVSVQVVDGEQVASIIRDRNFEILLYGESIGGDPDVYAFWDSSQISATGLNLASYSNPDVDKLLTDARSTTNLDERIAKYKKFQEIVTNDVPAIFLYSPTYTYVQASSLNGFSATAAVDPADRLATIGSWYLKTTGKFQW